MSKKPRVLVMSSVALNIGPAKTAEDYYLALNANGIECDLLLLESDVNCSNYLFVRAKRTSTDIAKLNKMYRHVGALTVPFFYKYEWNPMIPSNDVVNSINADYDIVYVVFWQEGFTFQTMKAIYNKLHCLFIWACVDYSTLAGGCHFVGDCERYKIGCGKCTAFNSTYSLDFTRINILYRKHVIKKLHPVLLMNEYMKTFYDNSYLWGNYDRIEIYKSAIINTEIFTPLDKNVCKEKYGIEQEKRVILFGSQNLGDKRKGISYLLEALDKVKSELYLDDVSKILVVGIGNDSDTLFDKIGFDYLPLSYVEMSVLPEVYSLADLFICSSINDAGPMMVNQALCCGTPVVGFDMGSVKSVVKDMGTGYCAKLKDSDDLAKGIRAILEMDKDSYGKMCVKCREVAMQTSSYEAFVKLIKDIYDKNFE